MSNNEKIFPLYFDGSFNVEFAEELGIDPDKSTQQNTTLDDLASCRRLLGANPYEYRDIP